MINCGKPDVPVREQFPAEVFGDCPAPAEAAVEDFVPVVAAVEWFVRDDSHCWACPVLDDNRCWDCGYPDLADDHSEDLLREYDHCPAFPH